MGIYALALSKLSTPSIETYAAAGYDVHAEALNPDRAGAIRAAGANVRIVLTNGRGGLSAAEMEMLPNLEIIGATSAGYEAVDVPAARQRGIPVFFCPGTNAPSVADSAMMLLLAVVRRLFVADRFVRDGGWQDQWRADTPTACGKRMGIVGMGRIGSLIAHRAAGGFDMEIGYHNRKPVAGSPHRYFANLIEMAEWANFLMVATPGGAGTRHLINANVLAALGPRGYLVNVGRGTVVDTRALIEALQNKAIAGAGLDVLEGEPAIPTITPELHKFENVVITPHVAGFAPESRTAATQLVIANLNAHYAGKPLVTPVQ